MSKKREEVLRRLNLVAGYVMRADMDEDEQYNCLQHLYRVRDLVKGEEAVESFTVPEEAVALLNAAYNEKTKGPEK